MHEHTIHLIYANASITYQSCICNSQPHVNTYISNKIICKTTNIMHNEIFNQVHASTFHIINTYEIHNNIHIFPIICSQRTYCKQFLIPRIQHTYMPSTQTHHSTKHTNILYRYKTEIKVPLPQQAFQHAQLTLREQ
jgi:hypothetical protein